MPSTPSLHIALVDDERNIRELVGYALRQEGYRVSAFADGQEAWDGLRAGLPDLLILDILMPRLDGLELCRRVRAVSAQVPIIFLTSKDEEFDRVLGLELGADDYLCKPFSARELVARVRVLFRRAALNRRPEPPAEWEAVRCGSLCLDLARHEARWRDRLLSLTVTEFRILHALVRLPGHVRTREQLLQEGYPHDQYMSDRTIDSHVKRLRRKLEEAHPGFDGIETVYGLGYRFRPDGQPAGGRA